MKLVVTVVGKDRVGIIAMVTRILADNNVNILSINQNIMDGFFNMILLAEASDSKLKLIARTAALPEVAKIVTTPDLARKVDDPAVTAR